MKIFSLAMLAFLRHGGCVLGKLNDKKMPIEKESGKRISSGYKRFNKTHLLQIKVCVKLHLMLTLFDFYICQYVKGKSISGATIPPTAQALNFLT